MGLSPNRNGAGGKAVFINVFWFSLWAFKFLSLGEAIALGPAILLRGQGFSRQALESKTIVTQRSAIALHRDSSPAFDATGEPP